ncbi:MAG TPA: pentapeptide repeat-containing protein [Chloroflexi bacterium]|nr:pentapeptide repeat-containing protein [Chloroflexota bacterium]
MREVDKNADRGKFLRDIAWAIALILALIWASVWTFNVAATALVASEFRFVESVAGFTVGGWITIAMLLVVPWASVAVGFRWQAIGGIMLVLAGLLSGPHGWAMLFGALPQTPQMEPGNQLPFLPCILLSLATPIPAVAAGCLFLISSWAAGREVRLRPNREHYETANRCHQTGESLRGIHLPHCDLAGVDLSNSDLEGANLAGADLSNAYLFLANLQDSYLESANLLGAYLGGANLHGARLAGATLDDTTVMPEGWEDIVASKPEDDPS